MAKKPKGDGFTHDSFKDDGLAIGQSGKDGLDIFPMSELAKRIQERDARDAAIAFAMEQSDKGFPDESPEDNEEEDS